MFHLRTSGNADKLGESKYLKINRGESGRHGDRRIEEKGRKEDKSRFLARDRRESKDNDTINRHGKGGSHKESKRYESSRKDDEELRHRHGSSGKVKEELRHKPESSGKDKEELRHRHGSSGKEEIRKSSQETSSKDRNDLIIHKPESSGKDEEQLRHRHESSGKDRKELRRLSHETFSKDRKDMTSHETLSKDQAGCSKDGRHNDSRKANIKEEEKKREDVKIKKLSRPNNEYFNQMIAKGETVII